MARPAKVADMVLEYEKLYLHRIMTYCVRLRNNIRETFAAFVSAAISAMRQILTTIVPHPSGANRQWLRNLLGHGGYATDLRHPKGLVEHRVGRLIQAKPRLISSPTQAL
jgi:hypothetical protein